MTKCIRLFYVRLFYSTKNATLTKPSNALIYKDNTKPVRLLLMDGNNHLFNNLLPNFIGID